MSADTRWPEFATAVAEIAGLPVDDVRPDLLLAADLAFDSLALAEVAILVADTYDVDVLLDAAPDFWRQWTLGRLFDECVAATA